MYDKHFRLTADIDLAGITFDQAVIAPQNLPSELFFEGTPFSGVFDGDDHVVRNLRIQGENYVGLFGYLADSAVVRDVGVENVTIQSTGDCVGGLAGHNQAALANCYSTGLIMGRGSVGGLVGLNCYDGSLFRCHCVSTVTGICNTGGLVGENAFAGSVSTCYSTGMVTGTHSVGGLVGFAFLRSDVSNCYSDSTVMGNSVVAGLVGYNFGCVSNGYSTGTVTGDSVVGGLVGDNINGSTSNCYSTGAVSGTYQVGGLVGQNAISLSSDVLDLLIDDFDDDAEILDLLTEAHGTVVNGLWDTETSKLADSAAGAGLPTAAMQSLGTYLERGWDFVGERANGTAETWQMPQTEGYPRLSVFEGYEPVLAEGHGTLTEPFLITNAQELGLVGHRPRACYRLEGDINLAEITWSVAVIPWFGGHFDGSGHAIGNLHIQGVGHLGLFGSLDSDAVIMDLGLEDGCVQGVGSSIGALAGRSRATLTNCHTTGAIAGKNRVGGLVGDISEGSVSGCYSGGTVLGEGHSIGGLVGNQRFSNLFCCYSTSAVAGHNVVGGLVGNNGGAVTLDGVLGSISDSYSTGVVSGNDLVGGLVGANCGSVSNCYSNGAVTGNDRFGGLVGDDLWDSVEHSFWDVEMSGQAKSDGGIGLTTSAIQNIDTYLEAGWDFVGEVDNGTDDLWWIDDGQDYPRLWWESSGDETTVEGDAPALGPMG